MNARERAAAQKRTDEYNARVRAEHARIRDAIMALRPGWDRAKLEAVTRSYGGGGLDDILCALEAADALELGFKS